MRHIEYIYTNILQTVFIKNIAHIIPHYKNYLTSDRLMTNGNDPAKQEPTSITRESTHNIALSSIISLMLKETVDFVD